MVIQRWSPIYDFRRMHNLMDRRWREASAPDASKEWAIPVDVVEEGDDILVRASLPGVSPDEIDVSIEDRILTIRANTGVEAERKGNGYLMKERRTGSFHRSLRLPNTVDFDKATTKYEHGLLTVSLPKAESKKVKHLMVASSKSPESDN